MKLNAGDCPWIVNRLETLAKEHGYSKLVAKVPVPLAGPFLQMGYKEEALVPGFYRGEVDAMFMGFYLKPERERVANAEELKVVVQTAKQKGDAGQIRSALPDGSEMAQATIADATEIAALYRTVFATYPFPIHDPAYIQETMKSHIEYFVVREKGELVAASSAEMDLKSLNVEMTDFATLPTLRGKGYASLLLQRMEEAMRQRGMKTAYTIARAVSYGMNITFARMGYAFGGTLFNNTNISGEIESMNIWYKAVEG
jgi:putative beta-lysine N-acetyltransferase